MHFWGCRVLVYGALAQIVHLELANRLEFAQRNIYSANGPSSTT